MSFNEEKIQLSKFILDSKDKELIRELGSFLNSNDQHIINLPLPKYMLESIIKSEKDIENGRLISDEEMRDKYFHR